MNKPSPSIHLGLALATTLFAALPANADFEGYYEIPAPPWLYHPPTAVGNWSLRGTNSTSELWRSPASGGFITTVFVLEQVAAPGEVSFTIVADRPGSVRYVWNFDPRPGTEAGFVQNDVRSAFTGIIGSAFAWVEEGDEIGWYVSKSSTSGFAVLQVQGFDFVPRTPPAPTPVRLTIAPVTISGQASAVRMTVTGTNGQSAVLQSSPDLAQWSGLVTNAVSPGAWQFTYQDPLGGRRFYRVVVR